MEFLYRNYSFSEVVMAQCLASIKVEKLAEISEKLGIEAHILIGGGEQQNISKDKRAKQRLLADCLKAIIAAIHVDAGYESTKRFFDRFIGEIVIPVTPSNS